MEGRWGKESKIPEGASREAGFPGGPLSPELWKRNIQNGHNEERVEAGWG